MTTQFKASVIIGELLAAKDAVENTPINQRNIEKFGKAINRVTRLVELGLEAEEEQRPKYDPDWEYDKAKDRRLGL
jgi:hypothetical protein